MQSYSQNAQKSNIFQQMRDWKASRAANLTNREVRKLSSLRSDKTHVDEALLVMQGVLIFVTLFTSYCAFKFYFSTFSKVLDPDPAYWFAIGLALVTEATKVFLLHRFLRSLFFGWAYADWFSAGGWLVIGALSIGAYWWSITISTDGMNLLTKEISEMATPKSSLTAEIDKATFNVDMQITAAQTAQKDAINTKWKGTTTWRAQKAVGSSAASIASLQEQRKTIVNQVTEDYKAGNIHREQNIDLWASWIRRYGGYMEWIAGICILAISIFERRLVFHHLKQPTSSPAPSPEPEPQNGRFNGHSNGHSSPTDTSSPFRASEPAFNNSVRLSESLSDNNTRRATDTDNDFLKLRMKRLKGYDDLFKVGRNKPETVATNMCVILNEIGTKFLDLGFQPSPETVSELHEYLTKTCFPVMEENGFYYKYKTELLTICHNIVAQAAAA